MNLRQSKLWNRVVVPWTASVLSLVYNFYWRWLMPHNKRGTQNKRILFVVHNQMMAKYLSQVAELLEGDNRLEIYVTSPIRGYKVVSSFFSPETSTYIRYRWARFQWWDLLIFAEHASVDKFHPTCKRLFYSHGVASGARNVNNEEYGYGSYVLKSDGLPCYSVMFDQCEVNKKRVAIYNSCLAERIAVVGDLRVEAMLELNQSRDEIRKNLGIEPDDTVCLFMSSWKATSLLPMMGKLLFKKAEKMMASRNYKFIITAHPNLWSALGRTQEPWDEYLYSLRKKGFIVIEPTEEWEQYLVASDITIADSTCLALTFAILQRPVILVPLPEDLYTPDSLGDYLQRTAWHLQEPSELPSLIDRAMESSPREAMEELSKKIYTYPGEGVSRMTQVLYSLLELDMPVEARHTKDVGTA